MLFKITTEWALNVINYDLRDLGSRFPDITEIGTAPGIRLGAGGIFCTGFI